MGVRTIVVEGGVETRHEQFYYCQIMLGIGLYRLVEIQYL
jgi:hypothetical protein